MKSLKWTIIIIACYIVNIYVASSQPEPYSEVNTAGDDRSITFYAPNFDNVEVWTMSSDGCINNMSRHIVRASCNDGMNFSPVAALNQKQSDKNSLYYDGIASMPRCNVFCKDLPGIFVSNRLVDGMYYNNDLYEFYPHQSNYKPKRIDELCSPYWDDTPALSEDGKIIYFASDRNNPGSGKADLFYSKKVNGKWSEPELMPISTKEYSEETPFVHSDGYLYYATNQTSNGDYDIWRVALGGDGKPAGTAAALDERIFPGVNKPFSNELHPSFSVGERIFLFASNRIPNSDGKKTKDFDIYKLKISDKADVLNLKVEIRNQVFDPYKEIYRVQTNPCRTTIRYYEKNSGKEIEAETDINGNCQIMITPEDNSDPCEDSRYKEFIIIADQDCDGEEVAKISDTLIIPPTCTAEKSHVLSRWRGYKPPDRLYFPVDTIPFFITGYWCPTTLKYKDRTLCNTIFDIFKMRNCPTIEDFESYLQCESNEYYNYDLKKERIKQVLESFWEEDENACIDMSEAEKMKEEFSFKVDAELDTIIIEMKKALAEPFIKEAIFKGKTIKVEIIGWTDQRSIRSHCTYTGETIDLDNSFVRFDTIDSKGVIKDYIKTNSIIKDQIKFYGTGFGGNQLLSDLRAYFTATLLDDMWQSIPEYNRLRNKEIDRRDNDPEAAPFLDVVAVGSAIKDIPNVSNAIKRSVDIQIHVIGQEEQSSDPDTKISGVKVQLCDSPCDCRQ